MRSIYKEERIPLQLRRFIIFRKICSKAKSKPNEVVHLQPYSKLAFGVVYLPDSKKYIAYGGVFNYTHTRAEVIEQGIDKLPQDDYVMYANTVKRQAFTKAVRTPFGLLIHWNSYVKNRAYSYIDDNINSFFPVNNELELGYPPHKFHNCLVATAQLPLWYDENLD